MKTISKSYKNKEHDNENVTKANAARGNVYIPRTCHKSTHNNMMAKEFSRKRNPELKLSVVKIQSALCEVA